MTMTRHRRVRKTAPRLARFDVTRAEFDRVVAEHREHEAELMRVSHAVDIQFERIAQIQADLDQARRACQKPSVPSHQRIAQLQADLDEIKKAREKMKLAT